jgi:hypothetical protein
LNKYEVLVQKKEIIGKLVVCFSFWQNFGTIERFIRLDVENNYFS